MEIKVNDQNIIQNTEQIFVPLAITKKLIVYAKCTCYSNFLSLKKIYILGIMEDQMTCIKCGGSENLNKTKPSNTSIEKLVDYAKLRTQYGESEYKPLHDKLQLLDKHKLENIKWHSDCYRTVVHKGKLKKQKNVF